MIPPAMWTTHLSRICGIRAGRTVLPALVLVALTGFSVRSAGADSPIDLARVPGLVDVATLVPGLLVELKYATPDNFLGRNVYGSLKACYLQREAAEMLADAARRLGASRPDLRLLAYDCARPLSVQRQMWALVKGTPQQPYVANPTNGRGSIHNYGCAIDLTLARTDGTPLDMGTPFDFFGTKAEPREEISLLLRKDLTTEQVANRLLLREVMVRAGFAPIVNEWWHFDCASPAETRRRYRIIE